MFLYKNVNNFILFSVLIYFFLKKRHQILALIVFAGMIMSVYTCFTRCTFPLLPVVGRGLGGDHLFTLIWMAGGIRDT
jgi:hypothetical protein